TSRCIHFSFFLCSAPPPDLPSFPTRRSSDLAGLGRLVAVKVPHPALVLLPAQRERVVREAHSAAKLHHPNIVTVFGWCNFATLRSEEHTSELQSLAYLVCRLLLEKKKKN